MLSHGTFSTRGKYWLICQFSLSIFSLFSLYCDITYASFLFVWRQYIDRPRASRHASNRSMLPWHATHPAALACSPSAGARFAIRIYSMRALCIFMFLQFSLFFNYGGKQCFFSSLLQGLFVRTHERAQPLPTCVNTRTQISRCPKGSISPTPAPDWCSLQAFLTLPPWTQRLHKQPPHRSFSLLCPTLAP